MEKKLYRLKGLGKARKRKGMTQEDLANHMGVTLKTVMNWEQGIANPSLEIMMQLSEDLDCDLDYLTGRIDEKNHDLHYVHEITGLSEEAISKVMTFRAMGYIKPFDHLIMSDELHKLLSAYRSFLELVENLKYTDSNDDYLFRDYRIRSDGKAVLTVDSAVHLFIQRAAMATTSICEADYQKKIVKDKISGKSYDIEDLIAEIKGTEEEIRYLIEHKEYLEKEVLPTLK